jgi:nitrous oxidase accessory protein
LSRTIIVPDDYPTIQGAIDNAHDGDTIFVRNGTYYENLAVNKTISLIGENKHDTFIHGRGIGTIITIQDTNHVVVMGFTVLNSSKVSFGSCITVYYSNNITVHNNILIESDTPIYISHCNNSLVSSNMLAGYRSGIFVGDSVNSTIIKNSVSSCLTGMNVVACDGGIVSGNNLTQNVLALDFWAARNFVARRNSIVHNVFGLSLTVSWNNSFFSNEIACSKRGVTQHDCMTNTFCGNTIENNYYGYYWEYAPQYEQLIFHNNFINNTIQTSINFFYLPNWTFDNGREGNYWSDYNGIDSNGDGIGDSPYINFDGCRDLYPLTRPYVSPDINGDSKVNMIDVAFVASAFGSFPGHPRWNPEADINKDGIINLRDIAIVARNFGMPF